MRSFIKVSALALGLILAIGVVAGGGRSKGPGALLCPFGTNKDGTCITSGHLKRSVADADSNPADEDIQPDHSYVDSPQRRSIPVPGPDPYYLNHAAQRRGVELPEESDSGPDPFYLNAAKRGVDYLGQPVKRGLGEGEVDEEIDEAYRAVDQL